MEKKKKVMLQCYVLFCSTKKKCEAVTTEPPGPAAGPEVPLVILSSTETSRVGGWVLLRAARSGAPKQDTLCEPNRHTCAVQTKVWSSPLNF